MKSNFKMVTQREAMWAGEICTFFSCQIIGKVSFVRALFNQVAALRAERQNSLELFKKQIEICWTPKWLHSFWRISCTTINNQVFYNSIFKKLLVCVWVWDTGSNFYTVTGVRSHFKHRGGFLPAFPNCNYLSLCTSGKQRLQLLFLSVILSGKWQKDRMNEKEKN